MKFETLKLDIIIYSTQVQLLFFFKQEIFSENHLGHWNETILTYFIQKKTFKQRVDLCKECYLIVKSIGQNSRETIARLRYESGACGRQNSKMASKIPSSPAPHGHGHRSPGYVNLRDFTLWLGYITWHSCLSGREIIPWAWSNHMA